MRNVLTHDYVEVNLVMVADATAQGAADLREYVLEVVAFLER